MLTDVEPYTVKMMAVLFEIAEKELKNSLKIFRNFGMISEENNIVFLPSFEKYQNIDALEKIRNQGRMRVERFREKAEKVKCNVTETLQVTQCNAIDKDKDIDVDKNIPLPPSAKGEQ